MLLRIGVLKQFIHAHAVLCSFAQSCPTFCNSMDQQGPTRFLCPWRFSRQEYWSGLPCRPPGDLFNPGIEHRSPALQADSLPSESPGKPKNTGVGSLSILQGIFPTQRSNPGLPRCRQILYQLSHKESPRILEWVAYPFSSIFQTQILNWGLLHCRKILNQLSYQGSPCYY